jgi:hypothetical protein
MNRGELISELKARGFDYLPTSRCSHYLNDAYLLDICETEDWPFLIASGEGKVPLDIADLRSVSIVAADGVKIEPLDPRQITDSLGADLSGEGTPGYWYMANATTILTAPLSATANLVVTYLKAPPPLEAEGDEPLLPARYHTLIVDGAVARAYEDSDDYELAQNARENFEARLGRMAESLLGINRDIPDEFIAVLDPGEAA